MEKKTHLKLTPYNSSSLPSDEMIKKFKIHSDEVFSTSKGYNTYKNLPKIIRKKADKLSIEIKRYNSKDHGNILMVYHKNNIETEIFGSAGRL